MRTRSLKELPICGSDILCYKPIPIKYSVFKLEKKN